MRVLIWATTLQADVLALALHLDARPDCALLVVADGVAAFRTEPLALARPLRQPVLDRAHPETIERARAFRADVVVFDNHVPPPGLAPRLCSMWHGLGWKARGADDLRDFHRNVERLTGAPSSQPNSLFMAQCYGEPDRQWRVRSWGLDPAACRVVGMAFSDLLLDPPYRCEDLASRYHLDVVGRRTVLLSLTWHYGRIFPGTWAGTGLLRKSGFEMDLAFVDRLARAVAEEQADLLLCLHDRNRYEPHYLRALQELVAGHRHVELKHKSDRPDNLADLVVADVMVSNLSSFITYFYVSGRPTVHICPAKGRAERVRFAHLSRGRVRTRADRPGEAQWMNQPEDNGGLTAYSVEEAVSAVRRGLREPDCCTERARAWLDRHVHGLDGHTGERFGDLLRDFTRSAA